MVTLEEILQELSLPPSSVKIYKELLSNGKATARLLSDRLSLTRPSTYDHIGILLSKGLIVEKKIEHTTYYSVGDVHDVQRLLALKKERIEEKERVFTSLLPSLAKLKTGDSPTIRFFEGKEGLTFLMYDLLWSKGETIYTMWPHEEMQKVLEEEILVRFNERRIKNKITLHALWPRHMKPKDNYTFKNKDFLTKRRYLPGTMNWSMGYTVYGDKVSFISSNKEVFGFIVRSQEFALLMKMQFEAMWSLANEQ